MESNVTVICGFPGVGKSYLSGRDGIVDLDSSLFRWKPADSLNPLEGQMMPNENWAEDLVEEVKGQIRRGKNRYVLVSTHKEVRQKLREAGILYVIVAPEDGLRSEYMRRYLRRGSDAGFIYKADREYSNWHLCVMDDTAPTIFLRSGQYLSDVLPRR